MKAVSLTLTLLALAAAAGAQDYGSDHGRIRFADPGVTLQRASDTGAEEAAPNAPLLPGDRVWTDGAGRAQFQFRDGSVLSLDSRSKLDYLADDEASQDDGVSLRLWSGSLILHVRDGRRSPRFQIETPGGLVNVDDKGVYRIDAEPSETRLSVYDGQAVLDAARRRVVVEEGQTILVRRGEWPEAVRSLGRDRLDDFAAWDREQADLYDEYAQGRSARYLPEEVAPYASDFENNGTWHYETEVGYVWAPRVEASWRPYSNGRWSWTSYGWTWVPYERWGFAPSHFGRWGFSAGLGWYWIPGAVWSPAWVSWAVGGDYVGWCPLGHRDRPVAGFGMSRGSSLSARGPEWSFARRGDMASRDLGRRRLDPGAVEVSALRVAESPRGRPTRDLRAIEMGRAVTRGSAHERPAPRDSAPAVRVDSYRAVPVPQARRRDGEADRDARDARTEHGATARSGRERTSETPARWDWPEGASARRAPADARSGDSRSPEPRATPEPRSGGERSRGAQPRATREREPGSDRGDDSSRRGEGDHDVIRQLFKPLSEPRSAAPRDGGEGRSRPRTERPESSGGSSGAGASSRGGSAPRAEAPHRTESRPPAPAARPQGGDAERRKPPKDNH